MSVDLLHVLEALQVQGQNGWQPLDSHPFLKMKFVVMDDIECDYTLT